MSRYLVTSFKIVPRGTEGAVSLEGTMAGLVASVILAAVAYSINLVLCYDLSLLALQLLLCHMYPLR